MLTLDSMLGEIEADSRGKADYVTQLSNLRIDNEGNVVFLKPSEVQGPATKDIPFVTTDWAESQLLGRLEMPVQYFRRCNGENPDLYRQHFNYWAARSNKVARLRTRVRGDKGIIRGAVSEAYSIFDNDMVGEILQNILQGHSSRYSIVMFHIDDRRMHARLTFTDLTKPLGILPDGTPDYMRLGVDIVNSEVGASSFNMAEMIWRLVCSNGLRRWEPGESTFTQRHIHLRTIEFQGRVAEAIVNQLRTGREFLEQYNETQKLLIPNPFEAIEKLSKEGGFSGQFTDNVKTNFDGDDTAYGIVNAFTRSARELPNERRLEVESFAGKLVTMPASRWEQFQEV